MRLTPLLLAFRIGRRRLPAAPLARRGFRRLPLAPTLKGQYIIKNVVLGIAGLVIGATVRGGGLTTHPQGIAGAGRAGRQGKESSQMYPAPTGAGKRP